MGKWPQSNRRRRVSHPAIQNNPDVQLDHIPIRQPSGAPDPVNHLLVHRDAELTRKFSVTQKSAPCPRTCNQLPGPSVHVPRCDAGSRRVTNSSRTFRANRQLERIPVTPAASLIGMIGMAAGALTDGKDHATQSDQCDQNEQPRDLLF